MKVYIGCSGWQYKEWKDLFYPSTIPQTRWFNYYVEQFNTVEINNTFYRFPQAKTMEKWRESAPSDFKYCLKVPRFITHLRKFVDTDRQLNDFYGLVDLLQDKLGCVLFQLPGSMKYRPDLLARMLAQMDTRYQNVIEFRDRSWWRDDVYAALAQAEVSFCHVSAPADLPQDLVKGQNFYLRFHGTEKWFAGSHSHQELLSWLDKMKASGAQSAWIYFNNTMAGDAIRDARLLQKLSTQAI